MDKNHSHSLDDTLALMRDLRARCEWDAAQTPESLRPYLIEEAHELDDAIRLENDKLQLVSISKELSLRLSDFVSEYAFAEYRFKGDPFQLKNIKPRQDIFLKQEDMAEFIKSGGSAKCLTLRIDGEEAASWRRDVPAECSRIPT